VGVGGRKGAVHKKKTEEKGGRNMIPEGKRNNSKNFLKSKKPLIEQRQNVREGWLRSCQCYGQREER